MATFNASFLNPEVREAQTYSDPESGCQVYNDRQAFELCKKAYYLKQQEVAPAAVTSTTGSFDNSLELQQLRSDVAYLREQIDASQNFGNYALIISLCLGFLFVISLALVLFTFQKKKKRYDS